MKPIKIAIADDHPIVRSGIISLFSNFSQLNLVADAGNGKELIDKLDLLAELPDVCILDISMPIMNGYQTLSALKKKFPKMRFLVLTVIEKEYSIISMIKNGANGYILKGEPILKIVQAITDIHIHGYYYSDIAPEEAFTEISSKKSTNLLTDKELEFVCHCCSELSYDRIAALMFISLHTIYHYQRSIAKKLNIHNRAGLVMFAIQSGMIQATLPE